MIGATGRCKKNGDRFVKETNMFCLSKRNKDGEYIKQKEPCAKCKYFKVAQTPKIIDSPLKRKCVFECEHFIGFYNDHKNWIDCNVRGTSCRYFANDPYSLGKKFRPDERWIGYCKDFKQKAFPPKSRFESIIE
jgi:hypothetical protein